MIWMLKGYRLDRLFDSSIPRPVETNKTYQYRFELSILVPAWLEQSLHRVQKWEMIKSGWGTIFVDDLMKQIRAHCAGEGLTGLGFAMTTFMDAKRDSFNTSEEFVISLQQRFRTYCDLGYMQPPVSALLIMLRELKYIPELDKFIRLRYDALSKIENSAMAVIFQDYVGHCTAIINYIKRHDVVVSSYDIPATRPVASTTQSTHSILEHTSGPV